MVTQIHLTRRPLHVVVFPAVEFADSAHRTTTWQRILSTWHRRKNPFGDATVWKRDGGSHERDRCRLLSRCRVLFQIDVLMVDPLSQLWANTLFASTGVVISGICEWDLVRSSCSSFCCSHLAHWLYASAYSWVCVCACVSACVFVCLWVW